MLEQAVARISSDSLTLSVLIVDDQPEARARTRRLLQKHQDISILGEAGSGTEAVRLIQELRPQIVFLDVEMPEMDGFQVLEALPPEVVPSVVFVTAYDSYALKAFSVHAVDYLLKPFDAERLNDTLNHVRAQMALGPGPQSNQLLSLLEHVRQGQQQLEELVSSPAEKYLDRIPVKANDRVFFVRVEDIDYVESAGNYVKLHVGTHTYMVRETTTNLAGKLDPAQFARIHRSTIVNIDRIREMQPWFSGEFVVILNSGARLKLSRNYRDSLASRFDGKL